MNHHEHTQVREDTPRAVTMTMKQIIVGVVIFALTAGFGYLYGLGTNDAVAREQMAAINKSLDEKADKSEVDNIVKSMDGIVSESKLLREELARTREEMAAMRGRMDVRKADRR